MHIRTMSTQDFARIHEIDVAEEVGSVYRLVDGALVEEAHSWTRPTWDKADWQQHLQEWQQNLKPDRWLGAFDGDQLVGLASLRFHLTPTMAQLTTLHVSRSHRRLGVARRLLQSVVELVQEQDARTLYVSATPSVSAVSFYRSQGFAPTAEPNPEQFALEPLDIHMVRVLETRD